jgi:hypothetical protein
MIQKSNIVKIKRSQIHKALYNPRKITEKRLSRLADSMREFGLVQLLVWNQQTGNLVGGHQRLTILDADNMSAAGGGRDYELEVHAVNLPLEKEKKLNLKLNSDEIGGLWDETKVDDLLKELETVGEFDIRELILGQPEEEKKSGRKKGDKKKGPAPIDATFEVVVKCTDEAHQQLLFERLTSEGLDCRVLTL